MGSSPVMELLCLAVAFSNVLLVLGAPTSTSTTNTWISGNGGVNGINVDSPSFHIYSNMINNDEDECSSTLYVFGKGVNDSFDLSCNTNYNGVTSISSDEYALYENPDRGLSFYTDTPSTLVAIKKNKCTKRTYKTVKGKTTYTETSMSDKACDAVKKKMEEKKEENRKYWEQWQKDFDENMKKQFPPCFPFCDKDSEESSKEKQSSEEYGGVESNEDSGSEEITETDKTSPEYWRQWQKNFDAKMKKKFPPCFPFCNKKNPPKSDKDDKKKGKPVKSKGSSSESSKSKKDSLESSDEDTDVDSWNF